VGCVGFRSGGLGSPRGISRRSLRMHSRLPLIQGLRLCCFLLMYCFCERRPEVIDRLWLLLHKCSQRLCGFLIVGPGLQFLLCSSTDKLQLLKLAVDPAASFRLSCSSACHAMLQ
jgi:hypothetical protein